jgi:2-(1,2-epoxy-1,2-dihydrophenyl)acetyl-CoA isomerase
VGLSPDGGMTYFLPRVVGPTKALELLLDDPNLPAAEALAMGLVTEVVPGDQVMDRARERAAKLAKLAPHYVKMAKRLVGVSLENGIADHLQLERHGIADGIATEDARTAIKAFFSGEKPAFQGR